MTFKKFLQCLLQLLRCGGIFYFLKTFPFFKSLFLKLKIHKLFEKLVTNIKLSTKNILYYFGSYF